MADPEQPVDLGVRSDALEQIFRRVEEESERRALVEEMAETTARRQASPLPSGSIIPIFQHPADGRDTTVNTLRSERSGGGAVYPYRDLGRSQRTPWTLPPVILAFLGLHPQYHRSPSNPPYMLNLL